MCSACFSVWPWRGEHTALHRAHIPQQGDVVPIQWSVAGARREGSPGEGRLTKSGSPEGDHCVVRGSLED